MKDMVKAPLEKLPCSSRGFNRRFKIKLEYWLYISRDRSTNTMDRKCIPVQNKDVKTLNRGYQIQSSRAPAEPGFFVLPGRRRFHLECLALKDWIWANLP